MSVLNNKSDYFAEIKATWFLPAESVSVDKPIVIPTHIWLEVADELNLLENEKPNVPFSVSAKTWAQMVCFMEQYPILRGKKGFFETAEILRTTLFLPDHPAELIEKMIKEVDATWSGFWPKWFANVPGSISYSNITKDSLLPLAHRIWSHCENSNADHFVRGLDGILYSTLRSAPVLDQLQNIERCAPQVFAFYKSCHDISNQSSLQGDSVALHKSKPKPKCPCTRVHRH
jgi:hypothetical protein